MRLRKMEDMQNPKNANQTDDGIGRNPMDTSYASQNYFIHLVSEQHLIVTTENETSDVP